MSFGVIVKMRKGFFGVAVLTAVVLVGCGTGELVPSGAGLNSEVPSTVGAYRYVEVESPTSFGCDEVWTKDEISDKTEGYYGTFTYVNEVFSKAAPSKGHPCWAIGPPFDIPTGAIEVFVLSEYTAKAEHGCVTLDSVVGCAWVIDGLLYGVSASSSKDDVPVEKDLKKFAERFARAVKLKI